MSPPKNQAKEGLVVPAPPIAPGCKVGLPRTTGKKNIQSAVSDDPAPPNRETSRTLPRGRFSVSRSRGVIFLAAFLVVAIVGTAVFRAGQGDFFYWWMENRPGSPFRQYDGLIEATAARHGVDPYLLKALVWKESRFQPRATGAAGERGLMQVTEIAAEDWARAKEIQTFVPTDLFDPHTNLEVGTWYLARALRRHADEPDPVVPALAEFNAGPSRVLRWMNERESAVDASASDPDGSNQEPPNDFLEVIDFPSTREYIRQIQQRRDFYRRRGDFAAPE
jgi:soluble lytic murein transglycosylase